MQISNAQMGIWHSTWAFTFRMLRWAFGIPPWHSDFKCSDGHWAFNLSIQISTAQMGIRHSTWAFRFRMLRLALGNAAKHSNLGDFECTDEHSICLFRFAMLRRTLGIPPEQSDFECIADFVGHWAFQLSIQI